MRGIWYSDRVKKKEKRKKNLLINCDTEIAAQSIRSGKLSPLKNFAFADRSLLNDLFARAEINSVKLQNQKGSGFSRVSEGEEGGGGRIELTRWKIEFSMLF